MASHDNNQPSSAMLWTIIPASFLLALYFIGQNDKTVAHKERLSGAVPVAEKKVEMVVHHAAADTTAHPADTTVHAVEAPAAESHAAPAHH